jgi:hypothetical protein
MLTRWMSVFGNGQTVRFKFMSKGDFQEVYGADLAKKRELMDEWKKVGGDGTNPERPRVERALGKVEKLEAYEKRQLKDLGEIQNRNAVLILYKCVMRARAAAELGARIFRSVNAHKLPGGTGKYGVVKSNDPNILMTSFVLSEYFACADQQEHIDAIRSTFEQTAHGLGADDLTISDCAGRERVGPHLAEGIVPLRADSQQAMEEEAKGLDEVYEKRKKRLLKLRGDEPEGEVTKKLESEQAIEQQYMMRKYLESGDTKSIHIEFSYMDKYSIDAMARIILHEATHKFAATADFGYADRDAIRSLKPREAVRNADGFAYAGLSLLKNLPISPKELNSEAPPAIQQAGIAATIEHQVVLGKGVKARAK